MRRHGRAPQPPPRIISDAAADDDDDDEYISQRHHGRYPSNTRRYEEDDFPTRHNHPSTTAERFSHAPQPSREGQFRPHTRVDYHTNDYSGSSSRRPHGPGVVRQPQPPPPPPSAERWRPRNEVSDEEESSSSSSSDSDDDFRDFHIEIDHNDIRNMQGTMGSGLRAKRDLRTVIHNNSIEMAPSQPNRPRRPRN